MKKLGTVVLSVLEKPLVVFSFLALCYLFFPTQNSSLDAFYYAANIKFNEHIFLPHHLVYNALLRVLYIPFEQFGIDALAFSKIINSLFSVLNLYLLYAILKALLIDKKETLKLVVLAGVSYVVFRYSTENETYIVPITFSLLGSLYFLRFLTTKKLKHILFSGFFASVACLFHQVHFFWWLGLLIGLMLFIKNTKVILTYSITALLVPTTYILVLYFYKNESITFSTFFQFIFHDFYKGTATSSFGFKNIILTLINVVRSFVQVHSNILVLLKKSSFFVIPVIVAMIVFYRCITVIIKKQFYTLRKVDVLKHTFIKTHKIILVLQLCFAFYAVGNIEFLTMLPFLFVISFLIKIRIAPHFLVQVVLTLFLWNFSYAIFPNHYYNYYNDQIVTDFIIKNPDATFIVKNGEVPNRYYYETGLDNSKNILLLKNIYSQEQFDSLVRLGPVYTDIIAKPTLIDRSSFMHTNKFDVYLEGYQIDSITSYKGLYGISTIHRVGKK